MAGLKRVTDAIKRANKHRRFLIKTAGGNTAHITGNPNMPNNTKRALGEMIDAAAKAVNEGKL